MKKKLCLMLLLCNFIYSCDKSDEIEKEATFYLTESVFGCNNYESFDIGTTDHYQEMIKLDDYFLFGGYSGLIVKNDINGDILLKEPIWVSKMVKHNMKVMICSQDGIFELNSDLELTQKTNISCQDMMVTPDNDLIFTNNDKRNICKWDTAQDSVVAYTNFHQDDCISMDNLAISSDHEIWAQTCKGSIVRFKDGAFIGKFDSTNSPLDDNHINTEMFFIIPHKDDMLVVAKNTTFQMLRYSAGEWEDLVEFENLNETKYARMKVVSIENPIIIDDQLYVPTTLAGCNGVERFDLSTEGKLQDEDCHFIQDELFPSQCVDYFYKSESEGSIYVITAEKNITRMQCL